MNAGDGVTAQVKGIQFCVLSPEEIRRRSVVEVTENQAFAGNEPVPNGLFDPFMGVIDNNLVCATCRQTNMFCPGHFGHIEMARPVFYIQFFDIVRKLMRCVCFRCSRLVVNVNSPDVAAIIGRKGMSRQKRWEAMSKLCQKVRRCGHDNIDGCGARMPDKVSKTDDMKMRIRMVWKESSAGVGDGRELVYSAEDVLCVLQRVTDVDCEMLGFSAKYNRPEWMICTILPVPPPSVRPSVRQENGQRQEDDLTHKLSDIIKANNQIKQKVARVTAAAAAVASGAPSLSMIEGDSAPLFEGGSDNVVNVHGNGNVASDDMDMIDNNLVPILQYHVAMFIDNSGSSMYPSRDRTGRTLRSLSERLRHKEGRIRGNLMGKRVDFSARTVITPDPNLSIDELGVPLKIAMNLTFPEVVHPINIDAMHRLVVTGPNEYPGAKQVRQGGRTIMLRNHPDRASIVLKPGDVVERHLVNGDYVLFNRQPSLHKMSMMAHRVRVMNYNTFRLNVCVCASYNADFDGDEMNMHVPQSLQTHYELKQLAAVPQHILSPRYSKPIITIVQDIALGVYRISLPDVEIPHRHVLNLISSNTVSRSFDSDLLMSAVASSMVSGRRALSSVLPPTANMTLDSGDPEAADYDPEVHKVRIRNGRITSGVLNKSVFSRASTGLVHATYNTLGPDAVMELLNSTQKLICDWLVMSGFSVGIDDLVVPAEQVEQQREILQRAKDKVHDVIRSVHSGMFKNSSTKSNSDYIEEQISALLSGGYKDAGKLSISNSSKDNRMLNMINSGSKGKEHNFLQMTTALGGQSIEGKRVPDGFDHRTLPHFTKFDDSPESRGFVEHSFIQGLQPHEFFFHSMAGRIGLIDTAVMTSETGYIQRRLVKGMEDCKVHHDLSVRNASNQIIQFLYGDDGMDSIKLEHQFLPTIDMEVSQMYDKYYYVTSDPKLQARCDRHFREILDDRSGVIMDLHKGVEMHDVPIVYPVYVKRFVDIAVASPGGHRGEVAENKDEFVATVLDELEAMINELKVPIAKVPSSSSSSQPLQWMPVLLRCFLSPKVLYDCGLSIEGMRRAAGYIRSAFWSALASPGEMVGIVAAQSIGEISTQLTLNSVDWKTELLLSIDGSLVRVHIGQFIDMSIDRARDMDPSVLEDHGNGTTLAWINRPGMPVVRVLSPDEDGKISWQVVEAVTQHPPVNEDGSCTLLRVTTSTGRQVIATRAKSFLARRDNKLVACRGDDLYVGDFLPVADNVPDVPNVYAHASGIPMDEEFGFLMGAIAAKGVLTFGGTTIRIRSLDARASAKVAAFCRTRGITHYIEYAESCHHLNVECADFVWSPLCRMPAEFLRASASFRCGFLDAFFACSSGCDASKMIFFPSAMSHNRGILEDVSNVLTTMGIRSSIDSHDGDRKFILKLDAANTHRFCRRIQKGDADSPHEDRDTIGQSSDAIPGIVLVPGAQDAVMTRGQVEELLAQLDTEDAEDAAAILRSALNQDVFYDSIVSIEEVDSSSKFVYDLTVENTRTFQTYHGLGCYDTFHSSGIASMTKVTSGIPRMKELMSVSKRIKTPTMQVALRPDWSHSMERAMEVMSELCTTYIRDVVSRTNIFFDPYDDDRSTIVEDRDMLAFFQSFGSLPEECDPVDSPWVLRIEFDRMKMLELNVSMLDIELTLNGFYESSIACLVSDDNAPNLVCRLRISVIPSDVNDLLTEIMALEHFIMESLVIKGVPGIAKAMVEKPKSLKRFDKTTETFIQDEQWSIMTSGSNLSQVMCHPSVDFARTTTNDVYEVFLTLGIEAARQALIDEMMVILGDQDLNFRHLSLLVDTMSNRGAFMSIDRHGINVRSDLGPLAKCSFEQTTDMLFKAGVFAERDNIRGVSANTMLGQVTTCGTGNSRVFVDGKALRLMGSPVNLQVDDQKTKEDTAAADATNAADDESDADTIIDLDMN